MGFLDLNGDLGRQFGGLGLSLTGIHTRLTASESVSSLSTGPSRERAAACAQSLLQALGLNHGVCIEVHDAIPEHVGLGSGTQLALAVSAAIARLFDADTDLRRLAPTLHRGVRSGIGLGAFEQGGFIVDGGRGRGTAVPPVICRMPFPADWRVLLVFDHSHQGLNGKQELTAFQRLPPMRPELSAYLCRVVLMQVLPALAEAEFPRFSAGIAAIQEVIGDYFSDSQGGGRYCSPWVAEVLDWLKHEGVRGVGQSSWGPTGFGIIDSHAQAARLLRVAHARWDQPLGFMVCAANNGGAQVLVRERRSTRGLGAHRALTGAVQ